MQLDVDHAIHEITCRAGGNKLDIKMSYVPWLVMGTQIPTDDHPPIWAIYKCCDHGTQIVIALPYSGRAAFVEHDPFSPPMTKTGVLSP